MLQNKEASNLLPIEKIDETPTVESRIIAEKLGLEHKRTLELIDKHHESIEKHFGQMTFETAKSDNKMFSGRPTRIAHLNEEQALFVITLSKNSEKAVELKALVVKSFIAFRQLASDAILQIELAPLVNKAIDIIGSKTKLAHRMGVSSAIFTHIFNSPHLVSSKMLTRIESVCNDIVENGIGVDPELVQLLLKVDDKEVREALYAKYMGGIA